MKKIFALDKQLHFLGCYFLAASLYILFGWVWPAAYAALLAGLIKEWSDSLDDDNYWSWGDIVADVAGVSAFLVQIYLKGVMP